MTKKLTVTWTPPREIPQNQKVFSWSPWETNLEHNFPPHPWEQELHWPEGTLAILEHAFSLNRGRQESWSYAENTSRTEVFRFASRIYKRGIFGAESFNQVNSHGIAFKEDVPLEWDANAFYLVDSCIDHYWKSSLPTRYYSFVCEEEAKTLSSVIHILDAWKNEGSASHWIIIGSGILSDMGAFAASLQGCTFEIFPTTLLSMVDASIGGKTGVNYLPYGKNQLGTFALPTQITICQAWLSTLPEDEFLSGAGECLKHALIKHDLSLLENLSTAFKTKNGQKIWDLLPEIVSVKISIMEQDPQERGIRAILNFGHTLGHGIETLALSHPSYFPHGIKHGQAVAIGMIYALGLSYLSDQISESKARQISKAILRTNILHSEMRKQLPHTENFWNQLKQAIRYDKKNINSLPQWVLLSETGMIYGQTLSESFLEQAWIFLGEFLLNP